MIGDDIAEALDELRAQAASLAVEQVRITRNTGDFAIDANGRRTPTSTPVYEGAAALDGATTSYPEAGGATEAVQQQVLKLPLPTIYVALDGDLVEFLTGSATGGLAGVQMRIQGATPARSNAVWYRIAATRLLSKEG